MAISKSTKISNDMLAAVVALFPAGAIIEIKTGAPPAAGSAPTGTVLATVTLPATPWGTPAAGAVAKNGTWQDASADAAGTAGHFAVRTASDNGTTNDGTLPRITGTVTATGSGGDMTVDNVSFAVGQSFTVTTFSLSV